MRIAIFGGSFDPVHKEHVAAVRAAAEYLSLDKVFIVPSHVAPHKNSGAHADGAARLSMCRLAFSELPYAQTDDCEIEGGGTSYTFLTCRAFARRYPDAERYFLVGADMLEDFFTWKNPEDILSCVTLAAFSRGGESVSGLHEAFRARFQKDYIEVPFCGEHVSSTDLRVLLAFGKDASALDKTVGAYIKSRGLYEYRAIAPALALETEERREHSLRVALMAARRARGLGIAESKAILASALHDCGKYVPLSSPLLKGFTPPADVPAPVLHQYTGAYLAEHVFGIDDEEILGAIRFHTSGKKNMTVLEKLLFLADLLEEGRSFSGVEELRSLFYHDLDACFSAALAHQIAYLQKSGLPVYPLTYEAYEYAKSQN